MKKVFVFSLLAILVFTGCQTKDLEVHSRMEPKVFTATIDDGFGGDTKTSLDDNGNVLWKIGDQVSIFAASTVNEQYQVSDASDGKTAATLNKVGGSGFVAGTEINNNVAFYPYASTAEIAKSSSSYIISEIALPATQTYVAGSFGNGSFPMAAVTSSTADMNLKFKNVLGGLKLQLKGTATIASITVTGNNNEILCGEAEVIVANGSIPTISMTSTSTKTVTLDCGTGVTLNTETATPFIIALPPITMTGGFTVLVTDTEGKQMEISTTKSQTITRSSLLKMPVVNYLGYATPNLAFDTNSYLIYKANPTGGWDARNENYYHYESYLSGFSAKVVEMKFQLASSSETYLTFASDNILKDWYQELKFSTTQLIWNQGDPTDFRCSISLSDAGVSRTSLITLKFDGTAKTLSINGKSYSVPYEVFDFSYLLAAYYHESDEGVWHSVEGIPNGSKIYYIKGWDANENLVYLGYPVKAINPTTSVEEYCWYTYWNNSITYQFAHDSLNQGGYSGYIP